MTRTEPVPGAATPEWPDGGPSGAEVARARAAAAAAARRSGVRIELAADIAAIKSTCDVIESIWKPPLGEAPVTQSVLRALTHAGNYCALALDGDEAIGVCLGFVGTQPSNTLHSHITGVTAAGNGRHVGFALKVDQRAWALEHGLSTVTWTYDPLVRRNAVFNISKLQARPSAYLIDFYGDMRDAINIGQGSDRVLVTWDLRDPAVAMTCEQQGAAQVPRPAPGQDPAPVPQILLDDVDGAPACGEGPVTQAAVMIRVPPDIEGLRATAPERAAEWRQAVRRTLGTLMSSGWNVTSMSRDGFYTIVQPEGT
jgi:predicted GNAT superfamily acetyltransferase